MEDINESSSLAAVPLGMLSSHDDHLDCMISRNEEATAMSQDIDHLCDGNTLECAPDQWVP